MSGTLADDSKDVLDRIKADGTFDDMRVQVTEAVKRTVSRRANLCNVHQVFSASPEVALCTGHPHDQSSAACGG